MPLLVSLTSLTRHFILPLIGRKLGGKSCSEPLRWHKFFGHGFRFHKGVLVSPGRRRGLGKGTAFESPSPAVLSKSVCLFRCSQKTPSLRFEDRRGQKFPEDRSGTSQLGEDAALPFPAT